MRKNSVDIMVILGAIIHERYVHIGTQQGGDKTLRLDVISDKGRWIVNYSEFLGGLKSYILSRDEGRVAAGSYPPAAPTDPGVPHSGTRLLR